MSIRHSLLHLGQKRGKFFRMVSSRILSRVLFPQMGQRMNSAFSISVILHPDPYLFASFLPDIFGSACCGQEYRHQSEELPLKLYFEHRNWSAQRRFFLFCRRADRLYIWLYQYCKIELLQNCPNAHFFRQKNSPNCFTFVAILNSLHFRPQNNPFEQEHGCAKIVRYMAQNIQKSR